MSDEEIFEMVKHPIFELDRKDESIYSCRRVYGDLTSTLTCCGCPIVTVKMPETKDKIVEAIRTTYKIGAVERFRSFIDGIKTPILDTELHILSREVRSLYLSKY